jgi:MoaA/NifB/PqqE/SkfB family radical SAM enzyme
MISKAVVYRIYGDALAVVMHVRTRRVVLLQGHALQFWSDLVSADQAGAPDQSHPLYARLTRLGMLGDPAALPPALPDEGGPSEQVQEVDLGVLNMWAFKNHIPMSGHFELTGRCNLRCRHCYGLFHTRKDTLSTEQVFRILDDLRDCGTLGLVLTGGELFFREDILDILRYLSEQKFVVRINSNGTLIDEAMVSAMQDLANIYRIHISLYSSQPEIHDQITNSSGSYHKTLRALRLLKDAGFDVRINCSVMKSNLDTFRKVREQIGEPMGIPVHFDSEIFPKDDGGTENLAERLDPDQLEEYLRGNALKKAQPPKQKLCKAGFSFFSICEDGSLLPCLKMKRVYRHPLGQLTASSFKEIWQHSATVLDIRESITSQLEGCSLCELAI